MFCFVYVSMIFYVWLFSILQRNSVVNCAKSRGYKKLSQVNFRELILATPATFCACDFYFLLFTTNFFNIAIGKTKFNNEKTIRIFRYLRRLVLATFLVEVANRLSRLSKLFLRLSSMKEEYEKISSKKLYRQYYEYCIINKPCRKRHASTRGRVSTRT